MHMQTPDAASGMLNLEEHRAFLAQRLGTALETSMLEHSASSPHQVSMKHCSNVVVLRSYTTLCTPQTPTHMPFMPGMFPSQWIRQILGVS